MIRVHVQPSSGGWGVFESGALVADGGDSVEAENAARKYLESRGGGEIMLHLSEHQPPKLVRVSG